jgi:hypothetical protein
MSFVIFIFMKFNFCNTEFTEEDFGRNEFKFLFIWTNILLLSF